MFLDGIPIMTGYVRCHRWAEDDTYVHTSKLNSVLAHGDVVKVKTQNSVYTLAIPNPNMLVRYRGPRSLAAMARVKFIVVA